MWRLFNHELNIKTKPNHVRIAEKFRGYPTNTVFQAVSRCLEMPPKTRTAHSFAGFLLSLWHQAAH